MSLKVGIVGSQISKTLRQQAVLDFSFIFIAPKPRYERIIVEGDKLGRIIHSKPPEIVV